ncbi:hypothetical protein [Ornithinibacillus californiensis]|uniref:hypothetical protein n=1 Tax=Ornithinibacillus californiensis TaxID=161536 RepID=UPI00064DD840|nr:hypothetical protein [Ornithinibacillus californiensis]
MELRIIICQEDEHFETFARFLMKYRKDLYSSYDIQFTINVICDAFIHSKIVLLLDNQESVIGCFVYHVDEDSNVLFIEQALLHPDSRRRLTFIYGMKQILDHIFITNPSIKVVQFLAETNNSYINHLYSKFATMLTSIKVVGEKRNLYSTDKDQLVNYYNQFFERR